MNIDIIDIDTNSPQATENYAGTNNRTVKFNRP